MVIEENEKQDRDFIDDNDFIDDEVSNKEYSDNEYNSDQQCNVVRPSFELIRSYYNTLDQNMDFHCHLYCFWT